jgi:hypothetical protein
LEIPLKAQDLAMEEVTQQIPCGLVNKEEYASMDWVDKYMIDMGTLWDTGSGDTSIVVDIVAFAGYMMVYDNTMKGNNMQVYSLAQSSTQEEL